MSNFLVEKNTIVLADLAPIDSSINQACVQHLVHVGTQQISCGTKVVREGSTGNSKDRWLRGVIKICQLA